MTTSAPLLAMSETMFYVTTLVADRPREIDKVIDYFGDPPHTKSIPETPPTNCAAT
jgi:hypothetical protein